jgi:predicted  nucleic acid-binding Zn-ribbon protein
VTKGQIVLGPFYDPISHKMFLGPGMDFIPLNPNRKVDMVKSAKALQQEEQWMQERGKDLRSARPSTLPTQEEPPVAAQLQARFKYSLRDIANLSKELGRSKSPEKDKKPEVQELVRSLRREGKMSYSKVRRIILNYDRRRTKGAVKREISTKVVNFFTGETIKDWSQPEEGGAP